MDHSQLRALTLRREQNKAVISITANVNIGY